ncbi:terpenoid cyclases/Protein prenyltransferase, partial [Athelia psychrophila]
MSDHLARSPTDGFETDTSSIQAATEDIIASHIPLAPGPPPTLNRNAHLQYLVRNLSQGFPAKYTSQDASQPWLMFWTVQSFSVLQVGLDPVNKQKIIDTGMAWQHPEGGFGGGPGQAAHLLPTYAAVCALANVGRSGPGGGWDQIDRDKIYKFFMSLKQPDGSFLVTHHAEVDVRGIYCLLSVAYLLNMLTPELVAGTPAFVASCQTYEGGFSSASQPYFSEATPSPSSLLASPRPALGEAHGGYAFCALASWVMLQPFLADPAAPDAPRVNYKKLTRWLTQLQGAEVELGGLKGRTNKLVDGCYSWWVGGSFAFLGALGVGHDLEPATSHDEAATDDWHDADDSLLNRTALQEYILCAGQHPAGGLRDKPPKAADSYHTLYCLSGLSAAQHNLLPSPPRRAQLLDAWHPASPADPLNDLRKHAYADALSWTEEEGTANIFGGVQNRVNATHPLFNLTISHAEAMMAHFYEQEVLPRAVSSRTAA